MKRIVVVLGILAVFSAVVFKLTNLVCESHNRSWVVFNYCRLKLEAIVESRRIASSSLVLEIA
ncbi:uncharacterized protein Dwil_GK27463 [Drosophila willistoni]|uniref:Uncharacterized protein n=1 Tax=Drosophila willistoni TaxID=7260 RepID=A0A0Q9WQL5_DROWI|nr:uncharacterized protein Dwil_GK27463 [Drosophila willistoni]